MTMLVGIAYLISLSHIHSHSILKGDNLFHHYYCIATYTTYNNVTGREY